MAKAMMTDHELVKTCLVEIYRQNGYEDMARLTYRDHEHISQRIEAQTATLISVSTIKRLLNGEFSRIPQAATLQALARYLNYPGWQEYKTAVKARSAATETIPAALVSASETRQEKPAPRKSLWLRYATLSSGAVVAVVIAILFIRYSAGNTIRHADKARFSAKKVTRNDIPNTVVFRYNIDDVQADSFFIQQSWDANRRVRIYKNTYTLTDIYYEPGYHTAKLIANDSILRTIDVSIPTDRWFLIAKDPMPAITMPQYIKPTQPLYKAGIFRLDPADLDANQIDVKSKKTYVFSYHPSKFTVSSDSYTLKTRLRIREVRNNPCPNLMLEVLTQRHFMFFSSAPKGCAGELFTQFGENFFHGRSNDLSPLAYDVTQWTDVEIKAEHRKVTISLNGQPVFTTTYKVALGYLTGLAFVSNGIPEIDYIDLQGADGTVFYRDDFSQPL